MSSSPIPGRRESNHPAATPVRGPLNLAKPRVNTEQFRSPNNTADDNWDDDFASAISPSALQLPHLRPHDNFGGLLSSEKLKAFASFETVTEEANWDDNFEGDLTVKNPLQLTESDSLDTIRPYNSRRPNSSTSKLTISNKSVPTKISPIISRQVMATPAMQSKQAPAKSKVLLPPTKTHAESAEDDLSDIIAHDTAFERGLVKNRVGYRSTSSCPEVLIVHHSTAMHSHLGFSVSQMCLLLSILCNRQSPVVAFVALQQFRDNLLCVEQDLP